MSILDQDTIAINFANVYYIPVAKRYIDMVHLVAYTDFGEKVDFTSGGKTMAVLHFRHRNRV
jgi:hypothetical protein